jgi:antitoxin (DNA-binding transcriptional repressor) of toxin-antitoxin stability system
VSYQQFPGEQYGGKAEVALCGQMLPLSESFIGWPQEALNLNMAKQVIHVSDVEAARDFPSLLAKVRAGAEVIIEQDARPVAVLHPVEPGARLLSESLRLAREHGSKG